MSTATLGRDPFMPGPSKGRWPALALALLAHALLIAALAFGVHWRNSEPTLMAAELWSATPQAAAPRAVEPPPVPAKAAPEVKKPEPVVKPAEPVAAAKSPPLPDPQIAIEQARREAAKRIAAQQDLLDQQQFRREKQRAKDEQAQKKAEANQIKAEKEKAERDKAERAEAAKLATTREANLKRIQGLAGATGGATDTGTAARSSGPSASYAGRIMARIKPNIVFGDTVDGNPMATVEVKLAPDGTIVAKRLVKSSGVKAWDEAVLRAIERTEVLPRDIDGRVPPPFQIDFRLRD
jgi:colicin import membrane protein